MGSGRVPFKHRLHWAEIAAIEKRIDLLLKDAPLYDSETDVYYNISSPSYCEAFGVLQALDVLGVGHFGASNDPLYCERTGLVNLKVWFNAIANAALAKRKS